MTPEHQKIVDGLNGYMAGSYAIAAAAAITSLSEENERLKERLGPRGLEVVMIDGVGHYVSAAVKAALAAAESRATEAEKALLEAHAFIMREYACAKSQALDGEHVSAEARPILEVIRSILSRIAKEDTDNG